MLQYLRIRNLAVVETADLEFEGGFIAVTGETGAGKSVMLGALALLAGQRADKSRIRQGSTELEVEASLYFQNPDRINSILEKLGLPPCDSGQLIISRMVSHVKTPRILVNGRLTTQAVLQEIGESWLDVHGPGESQTLFKERRQLELLDLYARNGELLNAYADEYSKWRALLRQMDQLRSSERLSTEEVEFLQGQLATIDRAALSEDRIAELDRDFNRLESAQDLIDGAVEISEKLSGDDGAALKVSAAINVARRLERMDPELQQLADRLESTLIELEDISEEFQAAARDCEFDEEAASSIRERMEAWLELKRKYGPDVQSVLHKRAAIERRLMTQGDIEGQLEKLEAQAEKIRKNLEESAEQLRERRLAAAGELAKKASSLLARLGFKQASIKIEVNRLPELREDGGSSCVILFSSNPGRAAMPLAKVASSGELARVMLALKTVLADADETPVLVFDEVDANVGGEVAVEVGKELAALGARHQVFCVTHLPQVASQAPIHFVVEKELGVDSVDVQIRSLHHDAASRVSELARMLGGRNSKAAIEHAQTLLKLASPQAC